MEIDRNGLEILGRADCLQLLGTATLGRVGITADALPCVLPVNFRLTEDQIVFRTGLGTKLDAATQNAVVAFEVDDMDPFAHTGWSVVVTGLASEVTDLDSLGPIDAWQIPRWAPEGDGRVVALSTDMVSGRRIVPGLRAPGAPGT